MDQSSITSLFLEEFKGLTDRFVIIWTDICSARENKDEHIAKPGVYVFYHPERGVIKVGRHLTNSRKRALEHVGYYNTGGTMKNLVDEGVCKILFFNCKKSEDCHWVAALEIFFEEKLKPEIKSARKG